MDVNAFFSEHDEAVAVRWWRGTNGRPRQDHEAMMEVQPGSLWPKSYIFLLCKFQSTLSTYLIINSFLSQKKGPSRQSTGITVT